MSSETLKRLSDRLDTATPALARLDTYYRGEQPLAFLAPEAKTALAARLDRMVTNIPHLAVTALTERLRITGLRVGGKPAPDLWARWLANDLDQAAPVAHREALALARSYALVWADKAGKARVTVESPHQVTTLRDPASREVTAALKRWVGDGRGHAVLYEPDRITRYRSDAQVADPAAMPATSWTVERVIDNPLGIVPMVPLVNSDRLLDVDGRSELADLIPLVDALNKLLADLMVASEYFARPRRWASGVELEERPVLGKDGNPVLEDGEPLTELVNPFPEGNRMMTAESHEAKFGQLPGSDLGAYEASVRVLLGQIMAVSALPAHYVGVFTDNPSSADAMRAAEASLTARATARQATFGRAWEQVGRLMLAVETGTDPAAHDVSVTWADPATRSVAQEADAILKLHSSGLLPASYALARLGYDDEQVRAIEQARRAEQLAAATVDVTARAELATRLQADQGLSTPAALAAAGLFAAANETRNDTTTGRNAQ